MFNKFLLSAIFSIIIATSVYAFAEEDAKPEDDRKYKEYVKKKVHDHETHIKETEDFEKSDKFNKALLEQKLDFDVNIGNPDAKIHIVEYASLSCGHCKQFHETIYYPLKKDYIDTGKVYFTYRHYPLNGSAVKGALIVDCVVPENKQIFISALFKGQPQWAFAKNEAQLIDRLGTASMIAGLDKEQFQVCYDNAERQDKLLELMKQANQELNVQSTPTIFINGEQYNKARDYATFKAYIESYLNQIETNKASTASSPESK